MIQGIIGKKLYQSQSFTDSGVRIPVTVIEAGPCPIIAVKSTDKDGYMGVQLGFGTKKIKNTTKPVIGHIKKAGIEEKLPRFLRELRIQEADLEESIKPGALITVGQVFQPGDTIQVVGVSKGKGFAGPVKRHHFSGGPRTHGQSDRERAPGAIGQTTTPGRVFKGKRMAGRLGGRKTTVAHLTVVRVEPEKNLLVIKGVVPGVKNGLITIIKE